MTLTQLRLFALFVTTLGILNAFNAIDSLYEGSYGWAILCVMCFWWMVSTHTSIMKDIYRKKVEIENLNKEDE